MRLAKNIALIGASVTILSLGGCAMQSSAPANPMSFFVTSANPGKGADFGGLAGADAYCETLAATVGAQGRNWRAYLSTTASAGMPAINARDRIGKGPWKNAKGEIVANNIDELHGVNRLSKQMSLTEKGDIVSGRGDPVNMHDILTGSTADGRASDAANDTTCGNWTQSGEGSALVGHHDRAGLDESAPAKSWNSSHATKACDMDALKATGGAGLMYCFASK
jgi:hypothetical protein